MNIVEFTPKEQRRYRLWERLTYTRDAIVRVRDKELAKYDISTRQAAILYAVIRLGDKATVTEIARYSFRQPQTIFGIIKRMIKQGLLTKVNNTSRLTVALTEKGRQIHAKARKAASFDDILSELSDEEYSQLITTLDKIIDSSLRVFGTMNKPHLM